MGVFRGVGASNKILLAFFVYLSSAINIHIDIAQMTSQSLAAIMVISYQSNQCIPYVTQHHLKGEEGWWVWKDYRGKDCVCLFLFCFYVFANGHFSGVWEHLT